MPALGAVFVLTIAAMAPGIATVVPPAVVMAAGCSLVRTGAAVVGPPAVPSFAVV